MPLGVRVKRILGSRLSRVCKKGTEGGKEGGREGGREGGKP